ncbi:acyl carrier protein [Thauera chlorobenzoica]|uniref:Uncharacterized protein n=1 Tax=Thauera chlorobenzoica TaxID=96773 RepID=A0A1H5UIY9_9RHOO|nr:acyl carrier protein [Thauera chlorobenzoica]APR03610.1 hypothetical protein Tchl_0746 [Thauera chlorobenzoica]SEF74989.1 acyl carrier protein [Thauera chlorobenzoica]
MDSLAIIREFLDERLAVPPGEVQPPAALADLGVDSLMLLELMFEFEERLGTPLPRDIKAPRTVGELVALIDGLSGR